MINISFTSEGPKTTFGTTSSVPPTPPFHRGNSRWLRLCVYKRICVGDVEAKEFPWKDNIRWPGVSTICLLTQPSPPHPLLITPLNKHSQAGRSWGLKSWGKPPPGTNIPNSGVFLLGAARRWTAGLSHNRASVSISRHLYGFQTGKPAKQPSVCGWNRDHWATIQKYANSFIGILQRHKQEVNGRINQVFERAQCRCVLPFVFTLL